MTATDFLDSASKEAKFYRQPVVQDALSKAVSEIELSPAMAQSRILTRILIALARSEGEFRRADLTLLSVGALALIDSLLQGRASGIYSAADCHRAADRVEKVRRITDG